jgi:endoglucanase
MTELTKKGELRYLDQPDADFAYARLPDDLADAALKKRAIEVIAAYADYAIEFSAKNAFEIINGSRTDLPVIGPCTYFSAPAVRGYSLIRAYVLTKKPAYLAAAVQACNYSLGANPDNLSYCPGVGRKCVRYPFKVDAAVSGQFPDQPVGYIPYGQGDEGNPMCKGMSGWVQQWYLNFGPLKKMIPDFYTWPANEAYIDFGIYPMMNENTLDSTTLAAVYYWGFLAARRP